MDIKEITAESLKEEGNKALKSNNFMEAALLYTRALKIDPENYTLYSNRSLAYLKLKHYYLALSDAKESIALNPYWAKGYFRKGEVEYTCGDYLEAYASYKEALRFKPDDINILQSMNNTTIQLLRQQKIDKEIPWVGAGIGIIIAVFLLVAEYLIVKTLTHPLLVAFIIIGMSLAGYVIGRFSRAYITSQRKSKLQTPPNLEQDDEIKQDEKEEKRRTPRYTKSQARLRYKKGKA